MEASAVREGAYVIAAYLAVFYISIVGQAITQKRLLFAYKARGERFDRYYNVVDKSMLGWDRVVGNFLEQAVPFLTLFMINVALATLGVTSSSRVRSAGWIYVAFRALYPVRDEHLQHNCGQQPLPSKAEPKACSDDKYAVIIFLFINMLQAVDKL